VVGGEGSGHAFDAASQLVMNGIEEPSGYTEPGLHKSRLAHKAD
jgi:malate synthase